MNKLDYLKIISSPKLSEKTSRLEKTNQYVFKVLCSANKPQVKTAIEKLFGVKVKCVNICNCKGKTRTFRNKPGKENAWKKAYVTLQAGHVLDLYKK